MATFFEDYISGQQRFWYIRGLTSDEFYTGSCMRLNLHQLLFQELKSAGYERIVFYNHRKRLYCFDEHSYALLRGRRPEPAAPAAAPAPQRGRGLRKGAWESRNTSPAPSAPAATETHSGMTSGVLMPPLGTTPLHAGMQSNEAILEQFRSMMTNQNASLGNPPTAIVIDDADHFLRSLSQSGDWHSFMVEVTQQYNENSNIMIFIFPDVESGSILSLESMTEDTRRIRRLNTICIAPPDALEYYNMLHYFRLNEGLDVHVSEIPEIAKEIARCIARITQDQIDTDGPAAGVRIKMLARFLHICIKEKKRLTVENCHTLFKNYNLGRIPSAQELMNGMIGMASVKAQIIQKYGNLSAGNPRAWMEQAVETRIKPPPRTKKREGAFHHIVLTGNPGTGKTTVAKLIGQFFAEAGILPVGHVVEVGRTDLVSNNVGDTAIKTRGQIRRALGGILFIDEAYALTSDENDLFAPECIAELVKAMDEYKDNLIVVAAGYQDKMETFLDFNPGLKSRFREIIHIPDYTPEELVLILEQHMRNRHLRFSEAMQVRMQAFCENWVGQADEKWSNAREAVKLADDLNNYVQSHPDQVEAMTDHETNETYYLIEETHIPEAYRKFLVPLEDLRGNAMEDISRMPGLHSVKAIIKEIENSLIVGNLSDPGHYVFMGAPGTGKTTVARKMGLLFRTHKLLRRGHLVETKAGELVAKLLHNQGDFDKCVKGALDGVLFIDEAYQLMNTMQGQDIVDSLVKFMEDHRQRVCVILAGYDDEMADMLRTANPGLDSRVRRVHFDNYTGDELFEILKTMLPDTGLQADEAFLEFSHRALVRYVETTQQKNQRFGNARYIRSVYLQEAKNRMNARLVGEYGRTIPDELINHLTGADIPTSLVRYTKLPLPEPDNRTLLEQLDAIVGFDSIKTHLRRLLKLHQYQQTNDSGGKDMQINLNMAIKGNPGTGKTMIARLIGKVYKECGLLPDGRTYKVDRSDLVAGYVGQTAIKTRNWIEKAMGSVLFIDEAYALTDTGAENDFGPEAVTTLVAAMTDHIGEFAVIVAGYADKMDRFIRSNAGLNGRFVSFTIEDYTPSELAVIFRGMCKDIKFSIDPELDERLENFFYGYKEYKSSTEDWQNARECENLVRSMQTSWIDHSMDNADAEGNVQRIFTAAHIPEDLQRFLRTPAISRNTSAQTALEQIEALEGFAELKAHFRTLANLAEAARTPGMEYLTDNESLHLVLTGNPGTGKTTVARLIGKAYKELGLLKNGNLLEVTDKDLVAGYVGQTSIKTNEKIREALGGVLFIDEAYMLVSSGNSYGQEAIGTLLKAMSDLKGQFSLIVAGYQNPMKRFLDANPGLQSRFANQFHMPDHTDEQLISIFKQKCEEIKALPSTELLDLLPGLLRAMRADRKASQIPWANGREIENLVDALKVQWADTQEKITKEDGVYLSFTPETLPKKYADLLKKKQSTGQQEAYRLPESMILPADEDFTYPDDITMTEHGVVLIQCDKGQGRGYGSGSLLTSDGYILTCSHVIHGADSVRVRLKIAGRTDGDISWHSARIVRDDPVHDCALIKIDIFNYFSLSVTPENYEIRPADEIFLLGYPFGAQISDSVDELALSFFEGKVSSIQKNQNITRVFVNMEAKSGCSGAPVFSRKTGEIIGILCGSQTSRNGELVEEINYILPMQHIREMLFR